jgi:hypothetical protein
VEQTAQPYPFLLGAGGASGQSPDAGNTPWHCNERPRFYPRGGNIGFVPMPNGAFFVQVDLIPQPPALVLPTDVSIYQTSFKDAICWKTVEYALFSDNNSMLSIASQNYQGELLKLRAWKQDYQKMLPRGVMPITARTNFRGPCGKRMTSRF